MSPPDNATTAKPPLTPERIVVPPQGLTIDRGKALVAAAVLWLAFAAIVWLVTTGRSKGFDEWGLLLDRGGDTLALRGPPLLAETARDMTALGGVFLRNMFAIGAVVALLFLRLRREAVLFAGTVVGGWLVDSAIKAVVGRPRPTIVPHLTEAGGASFPSGHSFNSAVVYIAMALAFASMSARRSVRYTIVGSAMVLSALVAWSRVMLGVHFPTDVAAGWLGGAGWAFLAAALLYRPAGDAAETPAAEEPDPRVI